MVIFFFKYPLVICLVFYSFQAHSLETNWYVDSDHDRIVILDKTIQNRLKTVPDINASTIYDDQNKIQNFDKNLKLEITTAKKNYNFYTVVEGDTLESISFKLFSTNDRWSELLELNENLIFKQGLAPGVVLKYQNNK